MNRITLLLVVFIFSTALTLTAQQKKSKKVKLTGVITDYNNNPIKGAFIFVDSLKTKAKTNKSGAYKLTLFSDANTITAVSFEHGMINLKYEGQQKINFIFPEKKKAISKKELKELGYGIKSYGNSSDGYDNYINIYEVFKSRFSGTVEVIGESIEIRGMRGAPIFLVNGSEVSNISAISPQDIKSIYVDKTRTSLYGGRGAGGVIKIKLKQ
ncbi:MAG: TonB-dependent receptor plug domain-containing protein [Flavobacteriaceae bacterium]|nr:TonB-dependent receptor plug domain-containing protein [Flavobacteriaceae bacterium]